MSVEIKKKVCPLCHAEYPEEDNYCSSDGSRLEALDLNTAYQRPA
jgi:hypothetical protein